MNTTFSSLFITLEVVETVFQDTPQQERLVLYSARCCYIERLTCK